MSLKILVADDNKDSAESFALLLRLESHDVQVTHDGLHTLERVRDFRPAVAFLDVDMPGLNGYAIARAIRAAPSGADVCLVAVTGWARPEDQNRALDAGFDRHWVKPVDLEKIQSFLAELECSAK
jgi:CheY-like chemotaxis protein